MTKEVILTGIRSNAELTLGNYLGAVLPMVQLQKEKHESYDLHFFIPDLHSFTTPVDHSTLYKQTIDHLRTFAAAGFDLNNFAYMGELSRMTQFKDKNEQADTVSSGLFTYPVLMAADILLYDASWVPLGDDQKQHLELTRDLALRFNNKFGETFVVPHEWNKQLEFSHRDNGVRIRSLSNPTKKMSKSVDDPRGTILLSDTPEEATKKIMSATTDDLSEIDFDFEKRPGISNLLQIHSLLTNQTIDQVLELWRGKTSYGDLKTAVSKSVSDFLGTYHEKLAQISSEIVETKLADDEAILNERTASLLFQVQKSVGLRK